MTKIGHTRLLLNLRFAFDHDVDALCLLRFSIGSWGHDGDGISHKLLVDCCHFVILMDMDL